MLPEMVISLQYPGVNTVSRRGFGYCLPLNYIVEDAGAGRFGNVNGKKVVDKTVVFHRAALRTVDQNRGAVFDEAGTAVAERQAADAHPPARMIKIWRCPSPSKTGLLTPVISTDLFTTTASR